MQSAVCCPPGHLQMLELSWNTTLKADLFRISRDAGDIESKANEKFQEVVNELREVASLGN
ncbi:hypothetical protein [Fluviicola taffensis]|uniref:hypothetical protein n=1 Tax=Fluviicola taffensis TaxID=191579 RepID=UPI003137A3B6